MAFVIKKEKMNLQKNEQQEQVQQQPQVRESYSTNLNTRDVRVQRESATWVTDNFNNPKIGVLELSTKAVKLLLCNDQNELRNNGFAFNLFDRQAERTETGKGLDENNKMNIQFFNNRVKPIIRNFVQYAKKQGVDVLYSVATAAYRTAINREEILRFIKTETNLNVAILSKAEEADATLWAYVYSAKQKEAFLKSPNIILIDQGGGSTEISFFENQTLIESNSLGVGTTALRNMLFSLSDLSLQDAFQEVDNYSVTQIHKYLDSLKIDTRSKEIYYIGVGKSIQWAAGKNNREQHDKILSLDKMCNTLRNIDDRFLSNYTVRSLQKQPDNKGNFPSDFDMRLGLPMVIELMKYCGIQNVHISGTGLWYGIFFKEFYGIK
jgi:exopolyphosphatase/pppGpp-phosphohydrolase